MDRDANDRRHQLPPYGRRTTAHGRGRQCCVPFPAAFDDCLPPKDERLLKYALIVFWRLFWNAVDHIDQYEWSTVIHMTKHDSRAISFEPTARGPRNSRDSEMTAAVPREHEGPHGTASSNDPDVHTARGEVNE